MNVIRNLNKGKVTDIDGITSEHHQEAHDRLYILITIVMNMMLVHGYLPKKKLYALCIDTSGTE